MTCIRRNLDTQNCCNQWQKGIRTIDNQYPDDNRDFTIQAGTGVTITPVTAGIEISATLPAPPVPGPMTFRGTLGTGGTITSLPPATSANIGDVYVALESGTVPVTYETGDMVISNGITWVVIPSGDDPVDWSQILNTPDTIAGYGITDAYTKAEVDTALTDGSVTKIGTANVGTDTKPIKLVGGVPTVVTNDLVDLPSAQVITGVKTVPLEATGTFSDQIASSNKVKNELDNYTPMVRTTGNQTVTGLKTFSGGINNSVIVSTMNKTPENVGGKCLKVLHIPASQNIVMIYRISGGMNTILTGILDVRTNNISMNVINKLGSDTAIDETACMVATNADKTKDVFIKYRQNRRFNITIEKMYDTFSTAEYTNVSSYIDYSSTLVDYPVADGVNILSVSTSTAM